MKTRLSQVELDVPSDTLTISPLNKKKDCDVYPASPSLIKQLITNTTYEKWIDKRKLDLNLELDYDNRLRDYQKQGIAKIVQLKRCGIFDQQRLGKTPMVLASLKILDPTCTLIIVPKSLLINWYQECKKWYTDDVVIAKGTSLHRQKLYKENHKVIVISYMLVMLDFDKLPRCNCMVIDEAHRLRNFKGERSSSSPKSVIAIMKKSYEAEYKLALTGTPANNKSDNIYPILHFLHPELFSSYYKFRDYYYYTEEVYIGRNKTTQEIVGFKPGKQKELQEFLEYISLQRKRENYMEWIPKVDKTNIMLSLDSQEEKWYNDIAHTFESEELGVNCSNLLSQLTALRKITSNANEKRDYIENYLYDYPEESVIIVSEFTSNLSKLYDQLKPNYNVELLTGNTSAEKRKQLETSFNNKEYNVLLANIQCIKEGMRLEQGSTIIIIDPSLTYTDNEQLEDRILPTSKEKAINKDKQQIIYLIIENSIDVYIHDQLDNKKEMVDIINNFNKYLLAA